MSGNSDTKRSRILVEHLSNSLSGGARVKFAFRRSTRETEVFVAQIKFD